MYGSWKYRNVAQGILLNTIKNIYKYKYNYSISLCMNLIGGDYRDYVNLEDN